MVASVGSLAATTVIFPSASAVARDVLRYRAEIASTQLTPEQLAIAATAEDHTDEFLAEVRMPRFPRAAEPEGDDDLHVAAELERVRALRESARKEREGECLDCTEPVWAGTYCRQHHRPSD